VTQDHEHTDTFEAMKPSENDINVSKRISKKELMNWMYESLGSSKHSSLPLEVAQVSIDEIDRMSQRARQANQAVSIIPTLPNITDLLARFPRGFEAEAAGCSISQDPSRRIAQDDERK
jgi:hypothetical protein